MPVASPAYGHAERLVARQISLMSEVSGALQRAAPKIVGDDKIAVAMRKYDKDDNGTFDVHECARHAAPSRLLRIASHIRSPAAK